MKEFEEEKENIEDKKELSEDDLLIIKKNLKIMEIMIIEIFFY